MTTKKTGNKRTWQKVRRKRKPKRQWSRNQTGKRLAIRNNPFTGKHYNLHNRYICDIMK